MGDEKNLIMRTRKKGYWKQKNGKVKVEKKLKNREIK